MPWPEGMARMNASTMRGVGTSMISPAFMPAMSIGAGLTACRRGSLRRSVQLFFAMCRSGGSLDQRQVDVRQQFGRRGVARTVEIFLEHRGIRRLAAGAQQPVAIEPLI